MRYQINTQEWNHKELVIRGKEYRPTEKIAGAIIMSHGYHSSQNEYIYWARKFAAKGYWIFTFDFCGGGPKSTSDGRTQDMSVLTEVEELKTVVSGVKERIRGVTQRLILWGNSQGGCVSALTAAELQEGISALILCFPAFSIPDDARQGRMPGGVSFDPINTPETFLDRKMTIGRSYVKDAQGIDIFERIRTYRGPVFLIHGTADPIVNAKYSVEAWLTYTTGSVPEALPLAQKGNHGDFDPLPLLPKGKKPRPDVQLRLIAGAGHGFWQKDMKKADEAISCFLEDYTEILSIDVHLTGRKQDTKGLRTHLELPFTGVADSPWFRGEILPGAQDTQEIFWIYPKSKCADYTIQGVDYTGAACSIHIINRGEGRNWTPSVSTDSQSLAFLNTSECLAVLEGRKTGPIVRILTKLPR